MVELTAAAIVREMRAGDAREVAAAWLHEEWLPWAAAQGRAEGFRGAYVMGSLAALDDDADFASDLSDIDLAIAVDPAVLPLDPRYPHGRFSVFRNCLVQSIFLPVDVLGDREKLLTMLGLGDNLRNARILADPTGALQAARQVIAEEWAGQPWLPMRSERAIGFAETAVASLPGASSDVERLGVLTDLVSQLGGLVAIACAVTPTHRRSVALAAELLEPHGRVDLTDRLLLALGAQEADEASVETAVAEVLAALDIEQRYAGSSVDVAPDVHAMLPAFVVAGIRQIVHDGSPGAAMLPALQNVYLSATLVGVHGSEADRQHLDVLAVSALQRAGIPPQSWEERCVQLRELASDVITFCRSTEGTPAS